MDYFHNINVVNTQYERILISAVHMAHSAMKMSLFQSSLPLWLLEYTFPRFLPFNLLPKNFISSDSQWLAKLVLAVQLWSLHKISDQKKRFCRRWVVNCGRNVVSWLLRSTLDIKKSGYKPWGHCCVLGHNTLLSQCLSLYPGVEIG